MSNAGCELRDVIEVTNLSWGVLVGVGRKGECQWFVVRKYIELTAFDEVAEVSDGEVHCKQLAVKCAVLSFCLVEFLREVGNWVPPFADTLLQHCSNSRV